MFNIFFCDIVLIIYILHQGLSIKKALILAGIVPYLTNMGKHAFAKLSIAPTQVGLS